MYKNVELMFGDKLLRGVVRTPEGDGPFPCVCFYHGLEAMGHDVRILTLSGNLLSYQKGNVLYIGSSYAGGFYPKARMALVCPPSFLQELKAWHPDIVHSQTEFSTFLFAKRIARSCHGRLYIPSFHEFGGVRPDGNRLGTWFFRLCPADG